MKNTPWRATGWLFLLFLAAFAFWGARNHRLKIDSDPSTYLRFAEALARGDYFIRYPPDQVFAGFFPEEALFRGTYTTLMHGGRGMAFYSIGYPLYLAPFIAAAGIYGAFFANLLVFLALFVLLRQVTLRVFAGRPGAEAASLLAPALYWLFNREEVAYLLAPYRDPLAHALLLGATLALLVHLQEGRRTRPLFVAGLCFGFSVAVRETSLLAALPLGLFWARQAWGERRLPRPPALAAVALGALLGVAPLLAQNAVNTGNPFYPTQVLDAQVRMGNITAAGGEQRLGMRGLKLEHFRHTEPLMVRKLLKENDPVFIALLVAGTAAGFRAPGVPFLLLPFIAVFTLFFGLWVKPMMRYILVAQVAVAPLLAFGVASAAALLARARPLRRLPEVVAGGALLATAAVLLARSEQVPFQVPQAELLRGDIEALLPRGALVIAERPMRDIVDHLTDVHSVNPDDFVRPERGLTFAAGVEFFRREFPGVYFLETADQEMRDGFDDTPVTRARILGGYDLEPVARLAADRYGARDLFGAGEAALWRLVPWSSREAVVPLASPPGGAATLRLDGGGLPGPVAAEVRVDGALVGTALGPGLNWFALPGGGASGRPAELRVTAATPLPRDIEAALYGADDPIVLEAGADATPLDAGFLSPEFLRWSGVAGRRTLAGEGRMRVPAPSAGGRTPVLAALVRPAAPAAELRVLLDGGAGATESVVRGDFWRLISVPLRAPGADATAEVRVLVQGAVPGERPVPLAFDRFTVYSLGDRPLPLRIELDGGDDERWLAGGWHAPTRHADGAVVRFTDGDGRLRIALGATAPGRDVRLAVRLFGAPAAAGATPLRLAVNGTAVGSLAVAPDVPQELSFAVPAGALRTGLNEIALASPAWRPADLGAADARVLGLAIDELRLEDAGPAARPAGSTGAGGRSILPPP